MSRLTQAPPAATCAIGHRTRLPVEDDLVLDCGCVFDPHDLNSLAVALYRGVDIPEAVHRWATLKRYVYPEDRR